MDIATLSHLITSKLVPSLATLFGFGGLIAIHELGHFLFCKLFGIHTPTFSIGFGPELYQRMIGQTRFRLALIPFGGYCEIAGHEEVGQGDQAHAHDRSEGSFEIKPYWQKLLVMLGGIMCNVVFAYIVACSLFIIGKPVEKPGVYIAAVNAASPAHSAGLQANDRLLKLDALDLQDKELTQETASTHVMNAIASKPGQPVELVIDRDGKQTTLHVTLASNQAGGKNVGSLGVMFAFNYAIPQLALPQALVAGFYQTGRWAGFIIDSISRLFSRRSLEGAGGPVMIFSQIFSSAQKGFLSFFVLLALISINLALFNLLPFGALDGGQVLFITIEAAIRRKIPDTIKIGINLVSWVLFIGLTLVLTYRDVLMLFKR